MTKVGHNDFLRNHHNLLFKYVNPFSPNANYKEIRQLVISTATVGNPRNAVTFLKIANIKVPPTDKVSHE